MSSATGRLPPPPRAGLLNFVGPVGLSSHAEKTLEPLEHMVHTQTGPAGQFAAVGTLSPYDCYPAGPAGPYVAGGPVGPEVKEPLALLVRDHADPAGQHAVIQNSLLGPAGPKVKEPLALLVLE